MAISQEILLMIRYLVDEEIRVFEGDFEEKYYDQGE